LKNNPMNLRPQGHDIITFWLFNTVVKSKLHYKIIPWKNAMINGWMLDPRGKKMSKSKGNVIELQMLVDKYGADALRYMAASCTLGEDLAFPEKDVVTGQKTVTKLWNASKFVIMNLGDERPNEISFDKLKNIDKWLIIKLNKIIKETTKHFDNYHYFKANHEVDNFFWNTFCDYYLEIVKDRFFNPDNYSAEEVKSANWTLYKNLLYIHKMFSPIIPFITEEIYQLYFNKFENKKSIALCHWPEEEKIKEENIENAGDLGVKIIGSARKYKSENQMSLKEELAKVTINCTQQEKELIALVEKDIKATAKINYIAFKNADEFSVEF